MGKIKLNECLGVLESRGSKEIKHFVQTLVSEGLSKPAVVGRLVERYGQSILINKSS